jgi:NAD(P)-dependent dehydrogenase (short-subunit alcohol dehydrogenase family)
MAKTPAAEASSPARSGYRGPAGLGGKIAIVTGGTQGLGEAIARLFAERGAGGIVICGRNAERGERVAGDISAAGCPTVFVQADLAKVADCRQVVAKADERFGRVDALVNAAALSDRGNIFDTTEERYNEIFAVNARAPFFLIQETVRIMRREKIAGSIVNIQSMSAHGGQPFIAAYCASKGALATLTRNVAHSLLKFRIRVNGLNIGWMSTPGEDRIMKTYHGAKDGWLEEAVKMKPFGRLVDPKEVARACAFLCSDESGLMTGANIDLDQNVVGAGDPPIEP